MNLIISSVFGHFYRFQFLDTFNSSPRANHDLGPVIWQMGRRAHLTRNTSNTLCKCFLNSGSPEQDSRCAPVPARSRGGLCPSARTDPEGGRACCGGGRQCRVVFCLLSFSWPPARSDLEAQESLWKEV
uniref:Uncharacterized protein n=1 Tax=Rousettus aegyptiacus TaxID=9407 RepID=A0A7J8GA31_ROUAE|nr:hypothetical protein HJG63_011480 [Rousettus aegyptiacus]